MLKLFFVIAFCCYFCLYWGISLYAMIRTIDGKIAGSPKKMKKIKVPKWFKLPIPRRRKQDVGFGFHPEEREEDGMVYKYTFILTLLHYISVIMIAPVVVILCLYFKTSPLLMLFLNLVYGFIVYIVTEIIFVIKKW